MKQEGTADAKEVTMWLGAHKHWAEKKREAEQRRRSDTSEVDPQPTRAGEEG